MYFLTGSHGKRFTEKQQRFHLGEIKKNNQDLCDFIFNKFLSSGGKTLSKKKLLCICAKSV